ncbi:MAG TPA: tRNA lysidine(34) synthetase TilS, partial [Desulfobacteria bacterium]|nr:tRNA lysidine(34) synthetase TilS [Desulfobacteria bacterium]
MLERVRATIKKYDMLSPGDRVLTGVSGGPDSVALVHILTAVASDLDIEIYIAHLNHCFRGQDSIDDAEFVRELASKLELQAVIESRDVSGYIAKNRLSKQEGAREVRYSFFDEIARKFSCNKIATGHNANDQAETILNHFLRGSGAAGLGGIPPVRDGYVIRPLIEVPRKAIEKYCAQNGLFPRTDKSNLKKVYTRNRIRLELIPYLEKEYNGNLVDTLVRTGEIFRDEEKHLNSETRRFWKEVVEKEGCGKVVFLTKTFLGTPEAIQKRLIRQAWAVLTGSAHNLGYLHMTSAIEIIRFAQTGSTMNLPMGVILSKAYEKFSLAMSDSAGPLPEDFGQAEYSYQLKIPGTTFIPDTGDAIEVSIEAGNLKPGAGDGINEILIDMDSVILPLAVRNRRPGDWFKPAGFDGTKKLKKFLIDSKISRMDRQLLPVVVSGEANIV